MSKPRVYVTRLIPDEGLQAILAACDAEVWEGELPPPREVLLEKIKGKEGLLSLLTDKVDAELMDAAGGLRVISNYAVGFDNIDVKAATARGIPVGNTPGVLTETTADLAFALLMAVARRVVEGVDYVRAGRWKTWGPRLLLGQDVHGATLGLIGFGRIGQAMARRARGFNMRILYHDRAPMPDAEAALGATFVDLDTLLRESDFVSLHTDLNPTTHHMIDAAALAKMKPTAILINSARGPIVDPVALADALRRGVIAGAGLDVTEPEPIPLDDPLLQLPNCVIVPHIASASVATRGLMARMAAANLLAGLRGERLPNCVNPEVYQ
jgi:glyoxylate reductase